MTIRRWFKGRRALGAAAVLLLALVLSQAIGLFHGIVHGPVGTIQASQATEALHDGVSDHLLGGHAGHKGSAECRLFDQCSHVDALVQVPALSLPLVLTSFVLTVLAGLARARWHAHFQARGPPLVR